jgi:hypothetical protein
MNLLKDVDHKFPAQIVNTGELPYQAVLYDSELWGCRMEVAAILRLKKALSVPAPTTNGGEAKEQEQEKEKVKEKAKAKTRAQRAATGAPQ